MQKLSKTISLLASAAVFVASPALATHHDNADSEADPWDGFRGTGTEPFWTLSFISDRMRFEHMSVFTAEAPRVESGFSPNGSVFISQSENAGGRDFIVLVEEGVCSDGMSDIPYPQNVRVFVDGLYFFGCGGDPHDALQGEWHVTSLSGEMLPEGVAQSFSFDGMGGFFGSGGCNRFQSSYDLSEGLNIGPIASTRRACINPETSRYEHQLFSTLGTVISLELGEDDILTLVSEFEPVLTAERRPTAP